MRALSPSLELFKGRHVLVGRCFHVCVLILLFSVLRHVIINHYILNFVDFREISE